MRNVSYPQACADCLGIERCATGCICPGCNVVAETVEPQWKALAPVMRRLTQSGIPWAWSMYRNERCCISEVFAGNDCFLEVTFTEGKFQVWQDRPSHDLQIIWEGENVNECGTFVDSNAHRY